MMQIRIVVEENIEPKRLDAYLAEVSEFSRSRIQQLIKDKKITVNGIHQVQKYLIQENDEIIIEYENIKPLKLEAKKMDLDIIYEDEDVIVINKPKGLVVHPGNGHHDDTLVNGLIAHSELSNINGEFRPGIVHRLDKDTSGLMVVAKNDSAHLFIAEQLKDKTCYRKYYALVDGVIPYDNGEINGPIGRDKYNRQKYCVCEGGKDSLTIFTLMKRLNHYSLLDLELKTGRTHQIRVHLKYIGYPVTNDSIYGKKIDDSGQFLHAYFLSFIHPRTKERVSFETKLPDYINEFMEGLS